MFYFIKYIFTKKELSRRAFQLLNLVAQANDMELYEDDWMYARELAKSKLVTIVGKKLQITKKGRHHNNTKMIIP